MRLFLLGALLVLGGCPRSTPANPPASETATKRNVTPRSELEDWMLPLPTRGIMSSMLGLGPEGAVEARVVLDADLGTIGWFDGEPEELMTRPIEAAEVERLWALAEAAWQAPPPDAEDHTDYREVLLVLDSDDTLNLSVGGPMAPSPAATLVRELRAAR